MSCLFMPWLTQNIACVANVLCLLSETTIKKLFENALY